jgi:hypothetical protein
MTTKDMKKLSRADLLNLLIMQTQENEELEKKLKEAEDIINSRRIVMEESGSIAEVALKMNDVFSTAQKAADEYIENIKMRSENRSEVFAKYETEAKEVARKILQEATEKCRLMEEETEKNCREMIKMAHLEAAKAIEKQKADGEIKINLSIPTEE